MCGPLTSSRGPPRRISYDNARTSVSGIIGSRTRRLTDGFMQPQSRYLFEEHFCRVRRANEKGVVEGVVKYARLNYFVPVPAVKDFEELNAHSSSADPVTFPIPCSLAAGKIASLASSNGPP